MLVATITSLSRGLGGDADKSSAETLAVATLPLLPFARPQLKRCNVARRMDNSIQFIFASKNRIDAGGMRRNFSPKLTRPARRKFFRPETRTDLDAFAYLKKGLSR